MAAAVDPIAPSDRDIEVAKQTVKRLRRARDAGRRIMLQAEDGAPAERFEIPEGALPLIQALLSALAQGHAVAIIPIDAELTTQQAADFLGVSRPFVIGLIEKGELPAKKVNKHRRVTFKDLQEYKRRTMEARRRVLDELTAEAQEDGAY